MRKMFEKRARRFDSLATASSLGVLMLLVQGSSFAATEELSLIHI